jgi:hypothetical protein
LRALTGGQTNERASSGNVINYFPEAAGSREPISTHAALYNWWGDVVRRMTKIPSEWPEKIASTKISWSDDVVVWLERAGEACILERADALAVWADDRP